MRAEGSWRAVGWVACWFSSGCPCGKASSGPALPAADSPAAAGGAAGSPPEKVKKKKKVKLN